MQTMKLRPDFTPPSGMLARLLLIAPSATAALMLLLAGCSGPRQTTPAPVRPTVTVVRARKMDVPIIGRPNGTTRALGEVTIRARVKGFLKEKHFSEGSNVTKGQLLLVIDEEPFQIKVAQAHAQLEAAQAELEMDRQSKAREVSQAQIELDQAALDLARVEEKRETNLLARAATSRENVDRVQATRKKNEAQVRADQASLEEARADYDTKLLAAKAKVDKAQADLAGAKLDLGYCRMYAPIDGRAGELKIKLGNLVGAGTGSSDSTELVTIQQLDPMGVDIRPASRFLPLITRLVKTGLSVTVWLPGQKRREYRGNAVFVDNAVDPTTSTVLVKAQISNPDESLLPGEFVKVDVNVGDYADVIVVPEQALVEVQEGTRVLTLDAGNTVRVAVVKPLDTYQGLRALESGLKPDDKVIVEGVQLVRPGDQVNVEEADIQKYLRALEDSETADSLVSPAVRLRGSPSAGNQ
jgi:membrane fusion protein, multidrug efflux system